ncbi:MAG: heparinase II/III-family protein [Prevotella sp.]|nr:heparinase II/III-family protein [Prevotella sp.]
MRQSYISFGRRYAGKAWNSLPATVFAEYKKTGNRVNYERLMFDKRRQLAALVMAEIVEGQRRFLPDIVDGLQSTLEETWWGLPAHYKTELPRTEDQTVDLFNAETASLVAYTRYVLADELDHYSPLLTKRIDQEIARRILQPAVKTRYWWKTAAMNWNPWICSNWLACVLFCEHDEARKAEAIRQIEQACDAFMNAYPADGGCDEGPHYWDRAAASLFETQYLLGKSLHHDKLKAMESYIYKMYIGNDYAVNFADAHGNKALLNVNIAYPFGLLTGDKTMCQYAAYVGQQADIMHHAAELFDKSGNWPSLPRELLFLKHIRQFMREQPREPKLKNTWLPDLQIMTTREPFVAFKGGNNGESHNHNDVGSFIVYVDGEPLLLDPGVGEYTAKTFSKQRYEIWTMQSDYHNLPRINGCSQHDGKQYAARVVSYKPGQLTLDLADAYPKEASVRWWKRTVRTQDNRRVEVTDDYSLYEYKAPTQLVLMTPVRPVADKAGVVQLGRHRIRYDARQLEPAVEDISELLDPVLQQQWGQCMYRIVLTVKNQPLKTKLKYYIE